MVELKNTKFNTVPFILLFPFMWIKAVPMKEGRYTMNISAITDGGSFGN